MYEWRRQIQQIVDEIDGCIRSHDDAALTLRSLSRTLGYSEYYTTRKFREISGMQLRDYLRRRRLAFALREVREETGLEIEVGEPFDAWTLRAPGRRILGVDFVCHWRSGDVRLSHEHESFEWLTLEEVEAKGWEAEPVYRKAFELVEA